MTAHPRTGISLTVATALALSLGLPRTAVAVVSGPGGACTTGAACGMAKALPAAQLGERKSMLHQSLRHQTEGVASRSLLSLVGELNGEWDEVDGNVVFSYDFSAQYPAIGTLQVLVRGFNTTREAGTPRYRVGWDRAAYWLDFDGPGPGIPHLLGAVERTNAYVPAASGDPYPALATDLAVQNECTVQSPCTVNLTPFVLLREAGVDYSAYPDLAASVDLLFVANAQGQAIAAVVDVYDANEEYVETKPLTEGDQLQLSTVGFKLTEPQFVYVATYTDFVTLDDQLQIQLENHIPGVDFADPNIPADLNAGERRMKLLLDAYAGVGAATNFAFAGPFDLGFNWAGAQDFLHRNGFDALTVSPTQATLVAKRH